MSKTVHTKGYIALTRRIRARRLELGLTQQQLATRVGKSRTFIQKAENRDRKMDFLEAVDLLRALKIDLDDAARLVMEEAP